MSVFGMSAHGTNTLKDLTKSLLERLYLDELLTETQIAERFQTSQVTIGRRRKKWGIPMVGKTGALTRSLPELSEGQRELLLGSLLGDGTMNAPSSTTARYVEGHSLKQRGYTDWKADLMGPFVSNRFEATKKDAETGKVYKTWCFATKTTTHLREFYDLFYESGERVFPSNLTDLMTPRVLAVWYLDDGSLANRFHPRITFGLDDLSRKRAFRALRQLGLRPELHEQDGIISIEFPGQTDEFFEIVSPFIPECMAYKLPQESARREKDRNAKKLTADKAQELYDGGLSLTDIGKLYSVGSSTVHRRVHEKGPSRMGRPRKSYSLRAAEEALANFDAKEYPELSDEEKDRRIADVLDILRKSPFPATPPWDSKRAQEDLQKLRDLEVHRDGDLIDSQSWRGTICCQSFFPHRYRGSWRGAKSAYEMWHEDDALISAIKFQLEHGDPVVPHRVLRAMTLRCRTPGVFRPAIAKFMYETYCPKGGRVWDPCAGWGGRLMGAAAAGVHYLGTDVEPETVAGNMRLAEMIDYQAQVVSRPAQTFKIPGAVDMVFTSPPYFNVEHYGDSEDQSFRTFSTFESWAEGFMKPIIQRAHDGLREGGVLALNVAKVRQRKEIFPLPDRVLEFAVGAGFQHEETLELPLARLNRVNQRTTEPILVFRKR